MTVDDLMRMDADDVIVVLRSCTMKEAEALFYPLIDKLESGTPLEKINAKAGVYTIFRRLQEGTKLAT